MSNNYEREKKKKLLKNAVHVSQYRIFQTPTPTQQNIYYSKKNNIILFNRGNEKLFITLTLRTRAGN